MAKKDDGTGGYLDVDMNVGHDTDEAVENIAFDKPAPEGKYRVSVKNCSYAPGADPNMPINFIVTVTKGRARPVRYKGSVQGTNQTTADSVVCVFDYKAAKSASAGVKSESV